MGSDAMGRRRRANGTLDTELDELPPELRWREWMARVEAVIFAAPGPVDRETLARVVGHTCRLERLVEDIREELRDRPYDVIPVAGGWHLRTRPRHAEAIHAALGALPPPIRLSETELLVLACIAYHQPVTRAELGDMIGREVSRDVIAALRSLDLVAAGPRSPRPGAPYTYVTTKAFLSQFSLDTLRDLPDIEALEDAGLLDKARFLGREFPVPIGGEDEVAPDDEEDD